METYTSLVRTDGVVVLNTIAHIRAHLALIVDPGYAEAVDSVRDTEAFDQIDVFKRRIFIVDILDGFYNFFYSLQILRLIGKPSLHLGKELCCFHLFTVY